MRDEMTDKYLIEGGRIEGNDDERLMCVRGL